MATNLFGDIAVGEALQETLTLSFKAAEAITKGYPVKMSAHTAGEIGTVAAAGAGDKAIGVAMKAALAAGDFIPVLIIGVTKLTASGAITLGAPIKAAASGKVAAAVRTVTIPTGTTTVASTSAQPSMTVEAGLAFGFALQTTTTDGDTFLAAIGMGMP